MPLADIFSFNSDIFCIKFSNKSLRLLIVFPQTIIKQLRFKIESEFTVFNKDIISFAELDIVFSVSVVDYAKDE